MKLNEPFTWDILERAVSSWPLDYYRTIHSIKTAIACLIGLALVKYFNWPNGQWVPITIIVVMSAQTHFGAALQKAYMRFLGTIAGVTITVFTLFFFDANLWAMFIVVFLSCLYFTYLASGGANISYAGTLGGVTVILTLTGTNATMQQAMIRGLYIVIGIAIALLVSRFILPIHAREKLRLNVAKTLRDLRQLYFKTIQMAPNQKPPSMENKLDEIITKNLALQPQLIEEAAAGSHQFSLNKKKLFIEAVSSERKIYRLIYFMRKSIYESAAINQTMHNVRTIEKLHIAIENSLNNLADHVENFTPPQTTIDFSALLDTVTKTTATLPQETDIQKLLGEHSFLFLLEQIIKEVKILYDLLQQINTTSKNNNKNHR